MVVCFFLGIGVEVTLMGESILGCWLTCFTESVEGHRELTFTIELLFNEWFAARDFEAMLELTEGFLSDWFVMPAPFAEMAENETAEERLLKWFPVVIIAVGSVCLLMHVLPCLEVKLLGCFLPLVVVLVYFFAGRMFDGVVDPENWLSYVVIGDLNESGLSILERCIFLLC